MAEPYGSSTVGRPATTMDDLPKKPLLHILSFLPTLDAIQTTVISPQFRDLWTSLPSLSFNFSLFLPPCETPSETLQAFADFVNRALILRPNSDLRSLLLCLDCATDHRLHRHEIDSWIRYAVDHNAKYLTVIFSSKCIRRYDAAEAETDYHFPFFFLRNGSVRSLQLERCNLDLPTNVARMRFETLSWVSLQQNYLTDEKLANLIGGCLNLEVLKIRQCYGMKDLKIASPKLKRLELWQFKCEDGSVDISAPNLTNLTISFFEVGKFVMGSSALEQADVCFIYMVQNYRYWSKIVRFLGNVKNLHVQNWWYKAAVAKDCFCESFSFSNLNYLKLDTQYSKADLLGIAIILELSPNLETMILGRDLRINEEIFGGNMSEEFDRLTFSLPSLKQLKLNCFWGSREELHLLRLVLKSEVVLERIVLDPIRFGGNLERIPAIPIVLVKQSQGFQVAQGSFPGSSLHVYQGM